jgi:hypothetical protein
VVTLSDHYPCVLTLEGLPREDKKEEKVSEWNLAKEGGWNRYTVLMEEYSGKMNKIIENKEKKMKEVMEKVDKIHNKVKFMSFVKVTIGKRSKKGKVENKTKNTVEKDIELLELQVKDTDKKLKKKKEKKEWLA